MNDDLPPLPEPALFAPQMITEDAYTADQMRAYVESDRARRQGALTRLERIAFLIGSIYAHGDFVAETHNERELEQLLRENGTFWKTPAEVSAYIAAAGD